MASKHHSLGLAAYTKGDSDIANFHFREALILTRELEDEIIARLIFDGFAATMVECGDLRGAARLAAVAEGRGAAVAYTMEPAETGFRDTYLAKLRAAMKLSEFDEAYAEGRLMSLEAAIDLALSECMYDPASAGDT